MIHVYCANLIPSQRCYEIQQDLNKRPSKKLLRIVVRQPRGPFISIPFIIFKRKHHMA